MRSATLIAVSVSVLLAPAMPVQAQQESRPATTTFEGDTGLWFVPTGEVLSPRDVSFSVQRTEVDFRQGNTNVAFWPVTAAAGLGRMELFGAMRVITRIDRDTTPLLFGDDEAGGLVNEYPTVSESWSGNRLGDLFVGAKVNLASQERREPLAFAVRGTLKFPTAGRDDGAGTGKYDGFLDFIASRELRGIELAGFGGVALRGDPDDVEVSDGIRWGIGSGFPTRGRVRASVETYGEWMFDEAVTAPAGLIVASDGSLSPASSRTHNAFNTAAGVTWQHASGVLVGGGVNYRFKMDADDELPGQGVSRSGDGWALQFRVGFHGGVKIVVPPPPALALATPPPPAAPVPAPAPATPSSTANRAPVVQARCEPCIVTVGQTARLDAEWTDPDGDSATVRWSATGGTLTDPRATHTEWRAETAPGFTTITVVVEDARGGTASDTVTITVRADEAIEFEDVHFDFDSYTLRQVVLPLLDPVIAAMTAQPQLRLVIEGHTCNIGTAEYNLALGARRAEAVRHYLVQRGVDARRLSTISYGEEQPAHDNNDPRTRRLNRRAVLVVRPAGDTSGQ